MMLAYYTVSIYGHLTPIFYGLTIIVLSYYYNVVKLFGFAHSDLLAIETHLKMLCKLSRQEDTVKLVSIVAF